MKIVAIAMGLLALTVSTGRAAPGDPVAIRGSLVWPPALGAEPFAVIRGDDGRLFYTDLSTAQHRAPLKAGEPLSILGVQGARAHEISVVAVGPGDSVLAGVPALPRPEPAASPVTSAPAPATSVPPAEERQPWERLEGTVQSIQDPMLTLLTPAGRTVAIDVSRLGKNVLGSVKPGDRVMLFAVAGPDRGLTAVGFVHAAPRSGAATPGGAR
jgi:hypothetical protein